MTEIDPRFVEMIQRELDGELTGGDPAELDTYLIRTPAARKLRDSLRRMNALLERVADLEPPAALKEKVLAAVAAPLHEPTPRRFGRFDRLGQAMVGPRMLRYGAMAAVLLVAAVGFVWLGPREGSMTPVEAVGTLAPSPNPIQGTPFEFDEIQGEVVALRTPSGVLLTVELEARTRVETQVLFGDDLGYSGFESGPGDSRLLMSSPRVRVEGQGNHTFFLTLEAPKDPESSVYFRFTVDDAVVRRVTVDVGAAN